MKLTLKGVMQYPWLTRLDTKHDADGLFKVSLVSRQDTHSGIAEQLEEMLSDYMNSEEAKKANKGKAPKQHPEGLPFTVDEEAGTITFRMKNKCYRNKETQELWAFPMAFFDRDKNPLGSVKVEDGEVVITGDVPNVGGGTKAAISVEAKPWVVSGKAGISLRPKAFKIVELVEYTGGVSADDFDDDDDDEFGGAITSTSNNKAPAGMEEDDEF